MRPHIQYNVPISHLGRQVTKEDFNNFDYILAADDSNLQNLERVKPRGSKATVKLWGSYLDGQPIADPYYGGMVR
jgi:low molecular weight phosphotyrosine protein phosphatase